MTRKKVEVHIRVYSRPDRLNGVETGRTQWVAETTPPFTPFSAVLGRSCEGPAQAVQDWKFRAMCESYAKEYDVTLIQ